MHDLESWEALLCLSLSSLSLLLLLLLSLIVVVSLSLLPPLLWLERTLFRVSDTRAGAHMQGWGGYSNSELTKRSAACHSSHSPSLLLRFSVRLATCHVPVAVSSDDLSPASAVRACLASSACGAFFHDRPSTRTSKHGSVHKFPAGSADGRQ